MQLDIYVNPESVPIIFYKINYQCERSNVLYVNDIKFANFIGAQYVLSFTQEENSAASSVVIVIPVE